MSFEITKMFMKPTLFSQQIIKRRSGTSSSVSSNNSISTARKQMKCCNVFLETTIICIFAVAMLSLPLSMADLLAYMC